MIQLEELKSKLLELKPQIDDYRSAIGMDDLVKKQQELEEKTADPNFWNDLENSSRVRQKCHLDLSCRRGGHRIPGLGADAVADVYPLG